MPLKTIGQKIAWSKHSTSVTKIYEEIPILQGKQVTSKEKRLNQNG